MKLMTRQIRTSLKNCHSDMQLTLEDDINVPDSKPDIEHIIKIQGEIHVQETSAETDRAIIRGQLCGNQAVRTGNGTQSKQE